MPSIYDWSTTAADNDDADSGINWAEFQDPDTVNNSARQMMARQAALMKDWAPNKVSTGAANVYTVSSFTAPGGVDPPDGMTVGFIAHQTNAGASTLAVDSYGGRPLRAVSGTALPAGTVLINMPVSATYRAATNEWIAFGTGAGTSSYLTNFQSADITARLIKVGTIFPWPGATLPGGYLYANGAAVSRTTYSELFAAYGTTYGAGDGSTTFNLPDYRGRGLFGRDDMGTTAAGRITSASGITGTTLGATGGAQTVTIAKVNLPDYNLSHTLDTVTTGTHNHDVSILRGTVEGGTGSATALMSPASSYSTGSVNETTTSDGAHNHGITGSIALGGSSTPMSNMPPAAICNFIILALPSAAKSQVLSKGDLTLANGLNSNITIPSQESFRVAGPTGAFSLGGFTAGVDGQPLRVYNTTSQAMTLVNEDASSTAANRIKTLTGANVTLRTGTSYASFEYDGTAARWVLTSTN